MPVSKHVAVTTRSGRVVEEDEGEEQQNDSNHDEHHEEHDVPYEENHGLYHGGVPQFKFGADMTPEERLETQRWKEEERQKERQRQRQHVRSSSHDIPVGEAGEGLQPSPPIMKNVMVENWSSHYVACEHFHALWTGVHDSSRELPRGVQIFGDKNNTHGKL